MESVVDKLKKLKVLLQQGEELQVETGALLEKVDAAIQSVSDQQVRLVLMGSFSDGKTSAIAGLLGQVKENMKIDTAESSDELAVYHFEGVDDVEIVDTPGLFGTKEKEIDGATVKYSDITKKFISEANVLIYVCDAVNPVKQSHTKSLQTVLRDFGKLDSTIFVLNKMDEAGVDLLDDVDYDRMVETKKNALIERLQDVIGLTNSEAERLRVACIAADPDERGLDYWLQKKDSYLRRSHIRLLKSEIDRMLQSSDKEELKRKAGIAAIADVVIQLKTQLISLIRPVEEAIPDLEARNQDLEEDVGNFRLKLLDAKRQLQQSLNSYESTLNTGLDGCSVDTVRTFLVNSIGLEGKNISYHHVIRQLNQYLSECNETNRLNINKAETVFKQKCKESKEVIDGALKKGFDALGKVKVKNTDVLKVRDFLAKHFDWAAKIKFAPHGAKALAGDITKGLGKASGVFAVLTEVIGTIGDAIREKKLKKLKTAVQGVISQLFQQVYDMMNSEEEYFKNFAPSYLEMKEHLAESKQKLADLRDYLEQLRQYDDRLARWQNTVKNNN